MLPAFKQRAPKAFFLKEEENGMQTTLATITNGVDVTRLNETVTAVKAAPELGSFRFRIQNRWVDCGENRSEVQSF